MIMILATAFEFAVEMLYVLNRLYFITVDIPQIANAFWHREFG